jgi:hypothetical protein
VAATDDDHDHDPTPLVAIDAMKAIGTRPNPVKR